MGTLIHSLSHNRGLPAATSGSDRVTVAITDVFVRARRQPLLHWHISTHLTHTTVGVCGCDRRFNLRVLECRLAAMMLAQILSATADDPHPAAPGLDWQQVSILKQVEVPLLQHVAASTSSSAAGAADALVAAVQQLLPQASYTLDQV